jgi:hypothetical protein
MMWQISKAVDKCKSCEAESALCKGVSLIKNGSDFFTFSTLSGSKNVMQMSNEGKLLVFQTDVNGEKDISKPYLSFGRTSELVEIKTSPNKEPRKGYINKSSLTLQKAKASVTIANIRMPSDDPTDGVRLCKEISLNSSECKKMTELPNYECVKANVTSATSQKKKIESKHGVQ